MTRRMSRPATPDTARPARLLFDPLEPRILLNADVLAVQLATLPNQTASHDLLLQAVQASTEIGGSAQSVQRIEVLDQSDGGAVLAIGDLSSISDVAIGGNAGKDSLTVDLSTFGTTTLPPIAFTGGSGQNSVAIEGQAQPLTWQVDGVGNGTVGVTDGGAPLLSFSNVGAIGGGGGDVLDGPQPNTSWTVTGPGSGTVGAMAFAGMGHLVGAADNQDTFAISGTGQIAGGIDGGAGGYDSVVLNTTPSQSVALATVDSSSGSVSIDGRVTAYTGMEPVTVGASANLTVSLAASGANATPVERRHTVGRQDRAERARGRRDPDLRRAVGHSHSHTRRHGRHACRGCAGHRLRG